MGAIQQVSIRLAAFYLLLPAVNCVILNTSVDVRDDVLKRTEPKPRFTMNLVVALVLLLIASVALFLRVGLVYNQVFTPDGIKFSGNDAYFQMRLVDTMVNNFPRMTTFDPYLLYPGGAGLGNIHLFNWLLAAVIWLAGLGSPTNHTVDLIGAYFPAVLGALTVLPVFFAGKALFGRWAGIISAALLAILPGEFLGRSILSFTDQHVAEILLTTTTMLFLILAIKWSRQKELSFTHIGRRNWGIALKPIVYSLLAGFFLGLYILTWAGALLFVFIVCTYLVIQFIVDYLRGRTTDYLCLVGVILFAVALVISLPASPGRLTIGSLSIALLIPLILGGISRLMAWKSLRPVYYPLVLVGLGLLGATVLYGLSPSLFRAMFNSFSLFSPSATLLTTLEAQPFFFIDGRFSLTLAWGNFTTDFFLSLVSLGILIYLIVKRGDTDKTLVVVWSLVILAATMAQRRFAYYFVVNVALLTGYLSWRVLELGGVREQGTEPTTKVPPAKSSRKQPKRSAARSNYPVLALVAVVIFLVAFFWNIGPTITTASRLPFAPSDAWCSSLSWLKDNTPEPFGDPAAYYQIHQLPTTERGYQYPASAYGVMAWWDYGYAITRIAHRIPNANPGQDPGAVTKVASFFTSQEEASASKIAQELESAYIIIDYATATTKFWAIARWAGGDSSQYYAPYYVPQENQQLLPVRLYYPEYYRALSSRLYNFDGKAVTPQNTLVISYEERTGEKGLLYRVITSVNQSASYEEAEAYLLSQKGDNYKIVGANPFVSPVPLEALKHYRLIYSSTVGSATMPEVGAVSEVKIFEYLD